MSNKVVALFGLAGIGVLCGALIFSRKMTEDAYTKEKELKYQTDLEIARIKKSYPPEYWNAKAAEAASKADVEKARIESKERLELDQRARKDAEIIRKREFEKNAPTEYWEQKRIEEEEKTKREADKRRYEAELETTKLHSKALEESAAKMAEQVIKNTLNTPTRYPSWETEWGTKPYCTPWSINS